MPNNQGGSKNFVFGKCCTKGYFFIGHFLLAMLFLGEGLLKVFFEKNIMRLFLWQLNISKEWGFG